MLKSKQKLIFIGMFFILGLAWEWPPACAEQYIFHPYSKPLTLPEIALEDLNGKITRIQNDQGKVILLNFWATWCPSCRKEGPAFEQLKSRYGSQGIRIYWINIKESRETVLEFLKKEPLSISILLDSNGKVERLLGVWALPTTYIVNRRGFLTYRAIGEVDWTGVQSLSVIEKLLQEM